MTLPNPFYKDDLVTLYQGDCRVLLPLLALPDRTVVVTDPPYGIRHRTGRGASRDRMTAAWVGQEQAWDGQHGFDVASELAQRFPVACFTKPGLPEPFNPRGRLVWDKGAGAGMGDLRFPWKPSWELVLVAGHGWQGKRDGAVFQAGVQAHANKGRVHPTQKPVALLEHLIAKCPGHDVLDPFAGSGSTGVAAKRLGRRCILIEQDAHYCGVTVTRLSAVQPVLQFGVDGA